MNTNTIPAWVLAPAMISTAKSAGARTTAQLVAGDSFRQAEPSEEQLASLISLEQEMNKSGMRNRPWINQAEATQLKALAAQYNTILASCYPGQVAMSILLPDCLVAGK